MKNNLKGTGTALVTPFHENGAIDFDALEALIDFNINSGINFLVSLGTTGESATMTASEKAEVLSKTAEIIKSRVPLVAGFGGNNTHRVIEDINSASLEKVDAILSVSPYYNKPTQEGIFRHYEAIAQNCPLPVILYNVPGRTSSNISAETTLRLSKISKIIGVKEASGDMEQCMKIAKERPEGFLLLSGDDVLTLPMISFGADGVISVTSNAFPKDFANMVQIARDGDFSVARKIHMKLLEIMHLLFVEGNPSGIKCALKVLNICEENLRMPLIPVTEDLRSQVRKAIEVYEKPAVQA